MSTKKFSEFTDELAITSSQKVLALDEDEDKVVPRTLDELLNPAYGVEWDPTADTYTRLGRIASYGAGTPTAKGDVVPDDLLPIQKGMYGCVVDDDGVEQYRLLASDHTKKDTSDNVNANIDGSDGQVMIRVPEHWWKQEYVSGKHRFWVSPYPVKGFHHFTGGYIGKYPATLYDDSASAYIDGDGNGGADTADDVLASISGKLPWSNETRDEFRTLAENRGTGWHQLDNRIYSAVVRLMVIEFATLNMQEAISGGNTKFAAWDFATDIAATGKSNSDGETSNGQATTNGNSGDYVSYRGIEDIFGNLWQFVDGINVYNVEADTASYLYLCSSYANYADDTVTNYVNCGELPQSDNYGANLLQIINDIGGLFPASVGGSSTTKLTDYFSTYYDNLSGGYGTDWRVVLVGGAACHGARAGVFCVDADSGSSSGASLLGARLCFTG